LFFALYAAIKPESLSKNQKLIIHYMIRDFRKRMFLGDDQGEHSRSIEYRRSKDERRHVVDAAPGLCQHNFPDLLIVLLLVTLCPLVPMPLPQPPNKAYPMPKPASAP
jgi:hypothetical protein